MYIFIPVNKFLVWDWGWTRLTLDWVGVGSREAKRCLGSFFCTSQILIPLSITFLYISIRHCMIRQVQRWTLNPRPSESRVHALSHPDTGKSSLFLKGQSMPWFSFLKMSTGYNACSCRKKENKWTVSFSWAKQFNQVTLLLPPSVSPVPAQMASLAQYCKHAGLSPTTSLVALPHFLLIPNMSSTRVDLGMRTFRIPCHLQLCVCVCVCVCVSLTLVISLA